MRMYSICICVLLSVTLSGFRKIVFVDPTNEEESLATGGATIVTHQDGSLCMVYKPGPYLIIFYRYYY